MRCPVYCDKCNDAHELNDSSFYVVGWCECGPKDNCRHGLCPDCATEVREQEVED